jgi:glycerol-3-phosphate dehydrogenase
VAAAPEVARLIAPILDWDADDVARETERYLRHVEAERSLRQQLDDAAVVPGAA